VAKKNDRSTKIIEFVDRLLETSDYFALLEATWAEMGPEKVYQDLEDKYHGNLHVMMGIVDRQLGRANKIQDEEKKTLALDVIKKVQNLLSEKQKSSKPEKKSDSKKDNDDDVVHQARVKAAQHVSKESYDSAIDSDGSREDVKKIISENMEREKQTPEDGIDKASGYVADAIHETKETAFETGKVLGVDKSEVKKALKDKEVHGILQAAGYSLKKIVGHVAAVQQAYDDGLNKVFSKAHATKIGQVYHKGVVKADEVLEKIPALKKLTGPVVAGSMFLMWSHQYNLAASGKFTSSAVEGSVDEMKRALRGDYKLEEFIGGSTGMRRVAQAGVGVLLGGSVFKMVKSTGQIAFLLTAKKIGRSDWFQQSKFSKKLEKAGDVGVNVQKLHTEAGRGVHSISDVVHKIADHA
jgi:hypothetical protein